MKGKDRQPQKPKCFNIKLDKMGKSQKNENQKKREKENLTFETAMRLYGIFVCERERQRSGMRVDFGYK